MKITGINGSIRKQSSNQVVLEEFARCLPASVTFEQYIDLASIPAFDGRDDDPPSVKKFKSIIHEADGIFICSPEYAFGVPGALKNALDWTVGTGDFLNKPVALITASSMGERGHESLLLTFRAIAAILRPETSLLISAIRSKVKEGRITDLDTRQGIQQVSYSFLEMIRENTSAGQL